MKENRRDFLKKSGSCALGMASLATQMGHLGTMNALAQKVIDEKPEGGASYKALVCLFWSGGNDGNNMIIPNHNDASVSNYAAYSSLRTPQGLAIPQANLSPINVPRMGNLAYGMHPNLGILPLVPQQVVNNGIHELWGLGKLAVVSNVGTLVRPLLKSQYNNSAFQKPYQLFSHSDQVTQAQTGMSNTQGFTGWGGRTADRMNAGSNPTGLIPMITSIAGAQLFTAGQSTLPLAISDSNTLLSNVLNPAGFTNTGGAARLTAFNALRQLDLNSNYIAAASHVTDLAMQANSALQVNQEVTEPFPNTGIGRQLQQVARLIKKRLDLNVNRQVFYVQIGGFDTHTNQIPNQNTLFTQFSQAMRAFYNEMVLQGVSNDVTTFSLSDFGRTMNPAGTGGTVGSDHAWGNHMFVMGGSVAGGDFYGSKRPDGTGNYYPSLLMGNAVGAFDDADSSSTGRGRWIPTTSVEMYCLRLARWFGLQPADEPIVFPNYWANNQGGIDHRAHDTANSALNFML
ncbi:MAG: DUF1501 domain-containing protein [Pyrinomonadaceae bacterium]